MLEKLITIIAVIAGLLAIPGTRVGKAVPVPASPDATATAQPAPVETNACPNPPPWSDRAEAERCWVHYPPPFGIGVIVEGCQLGYSDLGDLICYGYWLVPGAWYPLLTATYTPYPPPPTKTPHPYAYP
jgi:hypothetical protein